MEGVEYVVVNVNTIGQARPDEFLTKEVNRVAQHGWKLVSTQVLSNVNWQLFFERPAIWPSA